jgi:hypothetical protein
MESTYIPQISTANCMQNECEWYRRVHSRDRSRAAFLSWQVKLAAYQFVNFGMNNACNNIGLDGNYWKRRDSSRSHSAIIAAYVEQRKRDQGHGRMVL